MFRTIAIGVSPFLLSAVLMGFAVMLSARLLPQASYLSYFAFEAITGTAIGAFVGALQKKRAGLLAAASVTPIIYDPAFRFVHLRLLPCYPAHTR
jgi:hypothetical protein